MKRLKRKSGSRIQAHDFIRGILDKQEKDLKGEGEVMMWQK